MKREDEIMKAAAAEIPSTGDMAEPERSAFLAGAHWADKHPNNPWRDAETDPPKEDTEVFILTPYGAPGCGTYDEAGKWYVAGFGINEVSWWMPIPSVEGGEV